MSRQVLRTLPASTSSSSHPGSPDELCGEEQADDGNADSTSLQSNTYLCHCTQHVALSPTFGVPALYFSATDSSGSPIPLSSIIRSNILCLYSLPSDVSSPSTPPAGSCFPVLILAEHPTLGTLSWHIHPCNTSAAVHELVAERPFSTVDHSLHWLKSWLLLISTVVNMTP